MYAFKKYPNMLNDSTVQMTNSLLHVATRLCLVRASHLCRKDIFFWCLFNIFFLDMISVMLFFESVKNCKTFLKSVLCSQVFTHCKPGRLCSVFCKSRRHHPKINNSLLRLRIVIYLR